MPRMRYLCTLILTITAVTIQAAGVSRIGVVNIETVFREYYKSKIAESAIKQQSEIYRTHLLKLNDQLNKLRQEYNVAQDSAQNVAISEEARAQAETEAKNRLRAIQEHQVAMQNYAKDRNQKMREFELARRQEILADITKVIKERAVAGKYDLIIDAGGKTTSDLPATLYFNENIDLTQEVIKQLNSTAGVKAK